MFNHIPYVDYDVYLHYNGNGNPLNHKCKLDFTRQYQFCGYILVVITHTISWDRHYVDYENWFCDIHKETQTDRQMDSQTNSRVG